MRRLLLVLILISASTLFGASSTHTCRISSDLVSEFRSASVGPTLQTTPGDFACSGVLRRSVFQHPIDPAVGEAVLSYCINVPERTEGSHPYFLTFLGIRDGAKEGGQQDGVRFTALANGKRLFAVEHSECLWRPVAVSLDEFAGTSVTFELRTHAMTSPAADWALWGEPEVVVLTDRQDAAAAPVEQVSTASATLAADKGFFLYQCADRQTTSPVADPRTSPLVFVPFDAVKSPAAAGMMLPDLGKAEALLSATYDSDVRVVNAHAASPVVNAGSHFRLTSLLRNVGRGRVREPIQLMISAPDFRTTQTTQNLTELDAGAELVVTWDLAAPRSAGVYDISLSASEGPIVRCPVLVGPASESEQITLPAAGTTDVVLQYLGANSRVYSAKIIGAEGGYLARLAPLGEALYQPTDAETSGMVVRLFAPRMARDGRPGLIEEDGDVRFTQRIEPCKDHSWMRIISRLEARRSLALYAFRAPNLHVGGGDVAEKNRFALVPGLEYLQGKDASSGGEEFSREIAARYVPNPLKLTAGLAVVQSGGVTLGLGWNPMQEWAPGRRLPALRFASPNTWERQPNHLISLMVPSVPEFCDENSDVASHPFLMKPGEAVEIDAFLYARHCDDNLARTGGGALRAVADWQKKFGRPEAKEARDADAEHELCRKAFLTSVWDENTSGWRHAMGWNAGRDPGFASLLMLEAWRCGDEQVSASITSRINAALFNDTSAPLDGRFARTLATHIVSGEGTFYFGDLANGARVIIDRGKGLASSQEPNGSWVWEPGNKDQQALGARGEAPAGIAAVNSWHVLRAAALSADPALLAAGLKGCDYVNTFSIPRGAQVWEVPLHAPDIMCSAQAVKANVVAFELTGKRHYLDEARRWASTGLPFLYLWTLPDRVAMPYAGISVFGATFFQLSWLARPVQWTALVYGHALRQLAAHLPGEEWASYADGILASAEWQQYTEGPSTGCYPDSYGVADGHRFPPDIQPEDILVNLYAREGFDPCLQVARLSEGVFVCGVGRIEAIHGRTAFRATGQKGATLYYLISGMKAPPEAVRMGDSDLPENADLLSAGWQYNVDSHQLIIRVGFERSAAQEIEVR